MNKTFVYETDEVRKTGRIATRPSPIPGKTAIETLVEIEPANVQGNTFVWKKWVPEKTLYEIKESS